MTNHETTLAARIASVAARAAAGASVTDREGRYPAETIAAFRGSGLAGLLSARDVGGLGGGAREASAVVEGLARACGSTAMIVCMHHCGAAVIEAFGGAEARRRVASGEALTTLAFSEAGSRSHFWAPVSTATRAATVMAPTTDQLYDFIGRALCGIGLFA